MKRLCIAALASALLLLTGRIAGAQTGRARIADTPIRGEATLASPIIATVKEGDPVEVVDVQGDWYRVLVPTGQGKPRVGYVLARLIEIVSTDGSPRATPAIAQGPPIAPTLAQLQRDRAREEVLRAEVEAAEARLKALQNGEPPTKIHSGRIPPPAGQHSQTREGFWFNGGLGFGSLGCLSCDGHVSGASGGLSLGGTMSDRLLLGFGTTGWYRSQDGVALSAGTLDARLRFYPSVTSGFFLTGGLGVGTITVGVNRLGTARETGLGLMLGLGWDIRVHENVSLTPFWNGSAVRTSNADANFGQIGLSVTIH